MHCLQPPWLQDQQPVFSSVAASQQSLPETPGSHAQSVNRPLRQSSVLSLSPVPPDGTQAADMSHARNASSPPASPAGPIASFASPMRSVKLRGGGYSAGLTRAPPADMSVKDASARSDCSLAQQIAQQKSTAAADRSDDSADKLVSTSVNVPIGKGLRGLARLKTMRCASVCWLAQVLQFDLHSAMLYTNGCHICLVCS